MIGSRLKWCLSIALAIVLPAGGPVARGRAGSVFEVGNIALDQGAAGLGQAIEKLDVIGSVLHTGAHPDDEDSALLAYLARGRQARTAYLSLTRGDGGQNLIGPELYDALGVIRTEEMMAARRLDGAEQFFTRAYDFGFSKKREEALARWDRAVVLGDMVRVIRTFRPLVIVSAWRGTLVDGHGHHQAAGLLTAEAFKAAADASQFPDQIAGGLRPWQAKKLYVRVSGRSQQGREPEPYTLMINTGEFDPLLGRSYYEIAMEGRSQHRSQDQGALQNRGPQYSYLKLVESSVGLPEKEKDIFENLDASLLGIAKFAGASENGLKPHLREIQKAAAEARDKFNPFALASVSEGIASGLKKIRALLAGLNRMNLSEAEYYETDRLLRAKQSDFSAALARSSGLVVDCIADDEAVTPGQTFNVKVTSYANADAAHLATNLVGGKGWAITREKEESKVSDGRVAVEATFKVTVPADAEITGPYWLKRERKGDLFIAGPGGSGIEPQAPPVLTAEVEFRIEGETVTLREAARYRYADKALGEVRRDLKVAPAVSISIQPKNLVFPVSTTAQEREITVSLTNNVKGPVSGVVGLEGLADWRSSPATAKFDLEREGERAAFQFKVRVARATGEASRDIYAYAKASGQEYREGYQTVAYPHIEPRLLYTTAKAVSRVIDLKVAPGLKVGYIEGAGDDFANALTRMNVDVRTIDARELSQGDLGRYDVIVTGIRVYEMRPDVIANNGRLLDYVRNGGTLIVQYNKNEYAEKNLAPFPVKMKRSPDRVTDERAEVTLLDPSHPLFNYPNKITPKDFEGWVQERGAYFLAEWDKQFKPLMATNDAGEQPKAGGALIASYGKGTYIYTAYAWFRQLPEGHRGAYRLIANMVSLPKAKRPARGRAARAGLQTRN